VVKILIAVDEVHRLVTEIFGLQGNHACMTTRSKICDDRSVARVDLHCHSTASAVSRLGVQRALGLPECATPPEEVYELAKRRGMDFVTISDHDTIAGALAIAHHDDVFISEELTANFRGEPRAMVHVLCFGITPEDHDWLQEHSGDVEECAEYMSANEIACALAHPFYAVGAPLRSRHRRRLAELFSVWETRNGSRAPELNMPASIYVETHGGTAIGGSDDHAGVDIGRTYTEAPPAATPAEFLEHVRAGRVNPAGEQGSTEKWAHAAMALTVRALGRDGEVSSLDPVTVLKIAERLLREGDAREGEVHNDLRPADARALLRAWLESVGLDGLSESDLVAYMQTDEFAHADLYRRARRAHERRLRGAIESAFAAAGRGDLTTVGPLLFDACLPAIPYAPSAAFVARERAKLVSRDSEPRRIAIVADGIGAMHGVTRTIEEIRERGVDGFEVEVIGTDRNVDRRLTAVAEIEIPHYAGIEIGVPSLPAAVEAITAGRYDLIHVCSPGPSAIAALLVARAMDTPLVGSYHTELATYAGLRSGNPKLELAAAMALSAFYGQCRLIFSPSSAADGALEQLGIGASRVARWDRGVDTARFDPSRRDAHLLGDGINVLYAGRVAQEKNIELLAGAFERAHASDPRLHLVIAGDGPEAGRLRERLGERASWLGWLEGEELAKAYASADMFCFASVTDTFGQVVLEAQASGLPVLAADAGGPRDLVTGDVDGLLREPNVEAFADALLTLAGSPLLRERLGKAAARSAAARTWARALGRLGAGYAMALDQVETLRDVA
jgi:glycosyltransferase involved in cell wall biosynthesis/predicted metal-dependent phosphoesterase TrpH